jgi:hypothetical protein
MDVKLTYGIWPNGCYVTYPEKATKENGTIDEKDVVGWYGSSEEAKAAIEKAA